VQHGGSPAVQRSAGQRSAGQGRAGQPSHGEQGHHRSSSKSAMHYNVETYLEIPQHALHDGILENA